MTDFARLSGHADESSGGARSHARWHTTPPWSNGTPKAEFEPIDFMAKLATLVLPPRALLTSVHNIFAFPDASLRAVDARGARPAACDRCRAG